MITVRIGSESKNLKEIDRVWLHNEIERRRSEGRSIEIEITVDKSPVKLGFSIPGIFSSDTKPERLPLESRNVIRLWERYNFNEKNLDPAKLFSFLSDISEYA